MRSFQIGARLSFIEKNLNDYNHKSSVNRYSSLLVTESVPDAPNFRIFFSTEEKNKEAVKDLLNKNLNLFRLPNLD